MHNFPRITAEQRQALYESDGLPVCVVDYGASRKHILMDVKTYELLLNLIGDHDPRTLEFLRSSEAF